MGAVVLRSESSQIWVNSAQTLCSVPDFIDLLGNSDIIAVSVGHVPLQQLQDIKGYGINAPEEPIGTLIM